MSACVTEERLMLHFRTDVCGSRKPSEINSKKHEKLLKLKKKCVKPLFLLMGSCSYHRRCNGKLAVTCFVDIILYSNVTEILVSLSIWMCLFIYLFISPSFYLLLCYIMPR